LHYTVITKTETITGNPQHSMLSYPSSAGEQDGMGKPSPQVTKPKA
jgi:hypothetical protein